MKFIRGIQFMLFILCIIGGIVTKNLPATLGWVTATFLLLEVISKESE
jgi:hypothetical protein